MRSPGDNDDYGGYCEPRENKPKVVDLLILAMLSASLGALLPITVVLGRPRAQAVGMCFSAGQDDVVGALQLSCNAITPGRHEIQSDEGQKP